MKLNLQSGEKEGLTWFCRDFARIGRRWAKLLSSTFLPAPCSFFFFFFPVVLFLPLFLLLVVSSPVFLCVCLFGWRGEVGATGVAASTGLEEDDDDEGVVSGQNFLSTSVSFLLCYSFFSPLFFSRSSPFFSVSPPDRRLLSSLFS